MIILAPLKNLEMAKHKTNKPEEKPEIKDTQETDSPLIQSTRNTNLQAHQRPIDTDPEQTIIDTTQEEAFIAIQHRLTDTPQEDLSPANIDPIPRQGNCIYLMFNLNSVIDQEALNKILEDFNLYNKSKDYYFQKMPNNYFLRIIGTAERASNNLFSLANSIKNISPEAQIFIGTGDIKHSSAKSFQLEGKPTSETENHWKNSGPGIFVTHELYQVVQDPETREDSHYDLETSEIENSSLRKVDKYIPKVSETIGGPDKLIGYAEILRKLENTLIDPDKKSTLLKGQAGIGKSRIILEILPNFPYIICSLDASNRNIPGSSLVTLVNQISTALEEDEFFCDDDMKLKEFNKKSISEKTKIARENPDKIVKMCLEALNLISFSQANDEAVLIIEDLHNIDRHSAKYFAEIIREFLINQHRQTKFKALISMRPEEMYKTEAEKDLIKYTEGHFGDESSSEINIPGLDFTNDALAHEFAYHCLDPKLREGKQLGPWYKTFGKIAGNSPFIMASLVHGVKQQLQTSGESIFLAQEILEEYSKINPKDPQAIAVYYHQKINNLEQKAKRVIQSIALAGGKLDSEQIDIIMENMISNDDEVETDSTISDTEITQGINTINIPQELIDGQYIKTSETQDGEIIIELQHEMLLDFILNSISDPDEKTVMSGFLYDLIGSREGVDPDVKFSLLHNRGQGNNPDSKDKYFWRSYRSAAEESLSESQQYNDQQRAYKLSKLILDKEKGLDTIKNQLEELYEQKLETNDITELLITSLFALAESAIHLGKFNEASKALKSLGKIHENNPELVNEDKLSLMLFEKAYLARKKAEMDSTYQIVIKNSSTISPEEKTICSIKLAFREGTRKIEGMSGYDRAIEILNQNPELKAQVEKLFTDEKTEASPAIVDIARLIEIRIPFDQLRNKIATVDETLKFDEDIVMQPLIAQKYEEELNEIKAKLEKMLKIKEQSPLIFSPYSELSLLDINAQLEAYLGKHRKAHRIISEAWRQADQMNLNDQAARYAKIKGDIYTIQALLEEDEPKQAKFLSLAIETYSKEGITSIDKLRSEETESTNDYNAMIRIQRIRAIALLHSLKTTDQNELDQHIKTALEDFQIINEISRSTNYHQIPEYNYYLLGCIGDIIDYAEQHGWSVEDLYEEELYPFMNTESVVQGINYGSKITDHQGEAKRKRKTLGVLLEKLIASKRDQS